MKPSYLLKWARERLDNGARYAVGRIAEIHPYSSWYDDREDFIGRVAHMPLDVYLDDRKRFDGEFIMTSLEIPGASVPTRRDIHIHGVRFGRVIIV